MNFPKDDAATHWTSHVTRKMIFYGLSASKIRSVIRNFQRKEEGVAVNTVAYMVRNDKPKRQEEIWVMAQRVNSDKRTATSGKEESRKIIGGNKLIIISAWRYPGTSKPGKDIPIPQDILDELAVFEAL